MAAEAAASGGAEPIAIEVRELVAGDRDELVRFRCDLWPDEPASAHEAEAEKLVRKTVGSTLPLVVLVALCGEERVGFVEVGLRSHADGCETDHAVGFLEGWYVVPTHRRRGVGRALVAAAEAWARDRGCREMASDTWSDERGRGSVKAHTALGFEVVDHVVTFRKALT
jgi:aminoglycoside 6'-N-acetyltransferase I